MSYLIINPNAPMFGCERHSSPTLAGFYSALTMEEAIESAYDIGLCNFHNENYKPIYVIDDTGKIVYNLQKVLYNPATKEYI